MLGLGHLNNSYNFSVSIWECLQPLPSTKWRRPQVEVPSPLCPPASQFHVVIGSRAEEGQYNLNFHNCDNSVPGREQPFDITVSGGEGSGTMEPSLRARYRVCLRETGNLRIRNERTEPGHSHSGPSVSGASLQPPVPHCFLPR